MLELVPLGGMVVELEPSLVVGVGASGERSIGAFRSVTVTGERLNATMAGPAAADFMIRTGAIGAIDARLTLRTHDDALIYVSYRGRLDLSDRTAGFFATIAPLFETGDERYAWLNAVQAIGKGKLTLSADGGRLDYELFAVA
jgi:hypothetical protein